MGNEKTCIWEVDLETNDYETDEWTAGCGYNYVGDPDQFIWCPYCGERIEFSDAD